jgi:uncharacterized membrane protein
MLRARRWLSEENLHLAFELSLLCKAALAVVETIGGIAAVFVTRQGLLHAVAAFTRAELAEDPHDWIATQLWRWAWHWSVGRQEFVALYLFAHGVVKLTLIAGLLRHRLHYYPAAIVVFGLFIAYQLYRYGHTHSVWLLLITLIDGAVIALTWHEYRFLVRQRRA